MSANQKSWFRLGIIWMHIINLTFISQSAGQLLFLSTHFSIPEFLLVFLDKTTPIMSPPLFTVLVVFVLSVCFCFDYLNGGNFKNLQNSSRFFFFCHLYGYLTHKLILEQLITLSLSKAINLVFIGTTVFISTLILQLFA